MNYSIPYSYYPFPSMSWFARLKQVVFHEPKDKKQLVTQLRLAKQREVLSAETLEMIEGALKVSEKHVREVMIPRAQMNVLDLQAAPDVLVKKIVKTGHSRFPVIGENRDDVQGIFLAKDLLDYYAKGIDVPGHQFNMRDMMRPAVFIPESKRLNVLLREFRTSRNHMAIVVDEYGGVGGLVTIEDVIEEIVGEIDDEYDIDNEVFIKLASKDLYSVFALTPIDEFNEYFQTQLNDQEFDTIGGLVIQAFGRLPRRGESIEFDGFHFEVARADKRRIQLLRVKRHSARKRHSSTQ
jgi:magnesium and cobalt transporter